MIRSGVGDHLLYRDRGSQPVAPWEAWSQLAALAEATTRVELGPLVAATSFHNPAMLAAKANAVDEISGGRLVLGLGAGWNEAEYRAFGFPFDHRVGRFEEAFTIIRGLLRDGHADLRGEYYAVDDLPLLPPPHRAGGPPLMAGSIGPRMLEITLPHVDAWNAWHRWFGNSVEGYLPLRDRVVARQEGNRRLYRVDFERLASIRAALDELWGTGLPRLKRAAEARARSHRGVRPE